MKKKLESKQILASLRAVACGLGIVFFVGIGSSERVQAQQAESGGESPSSALTEGLLELLNEPTKTGETAGKGAESTTPAGGDAFRPDLKPEDVGLGGVDTGEASNNPLEAVRQSMLIAAGYLERGVTNAQTQQLQQDIVQRLDELIEQAESSSNEEKQRQSSSEDRPQEPQTQATPPQSLSTSAEQIHQEEGQAQAQMSGQEESLGDPGQNPNAQNQPGLRGQKKEAIVDLSDPRLLQQSVWGQLPERVRKQMQSRMVERFLPSYREQIEAYFQALLQSQ